MPSGQTQDTTLVHVYACVIINCGDTNQLHVINTPLQLSAIWNNALLFHTALVGVYQL